MVASPRFGLPWRRSSLLASSLSWSGTGGESPRWPGHLFSWKSKIVMLLSLLSTGLLDQGHGHTTAEFYCIWVINTVTFRLFGYLWDWQPYSITELASVNFQDSDLYFIQSPAVWMEQCWTNYLSLLAWVFIFWFMVSVTYRKADMSSVSSEILDPVLSVLCYVCITNAPLFTEV